MDDCQVKLTKYLGRFVSGRTVRDDEDLFSSGFITSLSAIQLVAFVEREFGITIDNEDLTQDNFRTINNLSGLIRKKSTPSSA
jgi:acyl carrier protein